MTLDSFIMPQVASVCLSASKNSTEKLLKSTIRQPAGASEPEFKEMHSAVNSISRQWRHRYPTRFKVLPFDAISSLKAAFDLGRAAGTQLNIRCDHKLAPLSAHTVCQTVNLSIVSRLLRKLLWMLLFKGGTRDRICLQGIRNYTLNQKLRTCAKLSKVEWIMM